MGTRSRNRLTYVWGIIGAVVFVVLTVTQVASATRPDKEKPSFKQITSVVQTALAKRDGYQPGDLIHQTDLKRVLKALSAAGAMPPDSKKLLADTLPENDALVRMLSTERGVKFMRKVKEDDLIYDRMDRVSRVTGGERMLSDIIRLPDGEKLAKNKRPHGVPGFLDLLPKNSSGKVRRVKNYRESTGRIYTEKMLLERLQESYSRQQAPSTR